MWITLLLIFKVLRCFLGGICRERSEVLQSKCDYGLHCIIGCDIMGYTHKLNRTEMSLVILILKKTSRIFIMSHIHKCNFDFEIGLF